MSAKIIILIAFMLVLSGCVAEIDPSIANTPFGMNAIHYEYIIVLISLFGGIFCLIGGFILTILGFTGTIEWVVEASGFTSRLINASPGVLLMIIGLLITLRSRIRIIAVKKKPKV